jgi:hypothetical protein
MVDIRRALTGFILLTEQLGARSSVILIVLVLVLTFDNVRLFAPSHLSQRLSFPIESERVRPQKHNPVPSATIRSMPTY